MKKTQMKHQDKVTTLVIPIDSYHLEVVFRIKVSCQWQIVAIWKSCSDLCSPANGRQLSGTGFHTIWKWCSDIGSEAKNRQLPSGSGVQIQVFKPIADLEMVLRLRLCDCQTFPGCRHQYHIKKAEPIFAPFHVYEKNLKISVCN